MLWKGRLWQLFLVIVGAGVLGFYTSCTVRTQDLKVWEGVPVEALDTHSIFITMPMFKPNS